MSEPKVANDDIRVEQHLGNLLRAGVLLAAVVVLAGGTVYLVHHGREPRPDLSAFHGEPAELSSPSGIIQAAFSLRGRAIIQLGLLLLIATPVARVFFSVFAFARERDYLYVLLTLIVLGVLLYSLFFARLAP
jgi:uncharacterized membrane protein